MQIKIGRLRFRLLILPKIKEIWKVVEKLSCQQKCAAGGASSSLRIGKKHKATTGIPGDLISKYFIAHPFNLYRVSTVKMIWVISGTVWEMIELLLASKSFF